MSEIINKVVTKHEITGQVKVTKVYPELENLTVTPTKDEQSFEHPGCYGYNNVVVKAIDCKTLNITPRKESQSFEGMYDEVRVDAIVGDTLNIKPTATEQSYNGLYETVNVEAIATEEVIIDPDFKTQDTFDVTATEGKYITKATVNKDKNLVSNNILKGISIYGIAGTGVNGIDTSDATATASDILKDKTAYVNGEKIVGTMETGNNVRVEETTLIINEANVEGSVLEL